jgi:hypothetical protein
MNERQLKEIFKTEYNFESWRSVLEFVFGKAEYFAKPNNPFDESKKVVSGKQYGRIKLDDGKFIGLFEVVVHDSINIERNRQGLREIAAKHIDQNIAHGAIVFYYSPNQPDYRFSFISKWSDLDEETGELRKGETPKKRYTYLLGRNHSGTTAAKRIMELAAKRNSISIKDVIQAFSVEALNKEFFKKYKEHYEKFWRYIDNIPEYRDILIDDSKEKEDDKRKPLRDFSKKLLGRIVFLHFLQKKGWLGCPPDSNKWESGDPQFMWNFFQRFKNKDRFYSKGLVELFFNTLNNPNRPNNTFGLTGSRVPYLNGGLFDSDNPKTTKIDFPADYFGELFDFFEQYNFTIDENSPDEQEVGIDPEMLGHIFENLLEENREKGAFYTPKEIVKYMCQESLIQYLKSHLPEEANIEGFIRHQEISNYLKRKDNAEKVNQILSAVKVCDPAIGSGAFPIGVLQEIYTAKLHVYPYLISQTPFDPAETKKQIIQESIYGVDMEHGAVEIARLRFWLALVVDEDIPQPLPNLDYKIMQGNSLLERFEGVELGRVASSRPDIGVYEPERDLFGNIKENQIRLTFTKGETIAKIQKAIHEYFSEKSPERKSNLKKEINTHVHEHIDFNLELREHQLKRWIGEIQNTDRLSKKDRKKYDGWVEELEDFKRKRLRLHEIQNTEEKPYFIWHLFFKDVFDKGGFDIVIGNPPYIQLQKLGKEADVLQEAGFETFLRTGDIYCLFYEKSFQVLKENGILTFITSNKWMRGGYGLPLRRYFARKNPILVLDLGPGIFQSATVDTNILVARNSYSEKRLKGLIIDNRNLLLSLTEDKLISLSNVDENSWVILDSRELIINEAFEKYGKPLRSWEIQINRGILTGFNEAFIISEEKRNELIEDDPKCEPIIRPILKGREIERYVAASTRDYLINTHNGVKELEIQRVNVNDYPSIKNHLHSKEFWEQVKNRQDQGDTPYNLRNCAYLEEFKNEKVIWKRIGSIMRFAYSDKEIYCLDSTCIATGEKIKYLTALLNSKVCLYQLIKTSPQTGTGDQIISVQALEPLRVYYPDKNIEELFNNLVDYILFIKTQKHDLMDNHSNEDISKLFEDMIDLMVFELYFEDHIKSCELGIIELVNFPEIQWVKKTEDKKKEIQKIWYQLNEKNNPIRNRILTAESRSWIVKHINQVTSITSAT